MSPPLLTYTHLVRAPSVPFFLGNPVHLSPSGRSPMATLRIPEARKHAFLSKALHFGLACESVSQRARMEACMFCFVFVFWASKSDN